MWTRSSSLTSISKDGKIADQVASILSIDSKTYSSSVLEVIPIRALLICRNTVEKLGIPFISRKNSFLKLTTRRRIINENHASPLQNSFFPWKMIFNQFHYSMNESWEKRHLQRFVVRKTRLSKLKKVKIDIHEQSWRYQDRRNLHVTWLVTKTGFCPLKVSSTCHLSD